MVDVKIKECVKQLFPVARDVCRAYSTGGKIIPAVACLAQKVQESGWLINPPGGVYFGVKAPANSNSPKIVTGTWEDGPGGAEHIKAAFYQYGNFRDAVVGYCEFIVQNKRYRDALSLNRGIPERYLFYVRYTEGHTGDPDETGYATDHNYYPACSAIVQVILAALRELGMQEG